MDESNPELEIEIIGILGQIEPSGIIQISTLLSEAADHALGGQQRHLTQLTSAEWSRMLTEFYTLLHRKLPGGRYVHTRVHITSKVFHDQLQCPLDYDQFATAIEVAEATLHPSRK